MTCSCVTYSIMVLRIIYMFSLIIVSKRCCVAVRLTSQHFTETFPVLGGPLFAGPFLAEVQCCCPPSAISYILCIEPFISLSLVLTLCTVCEVGKRSAISVCLRLVVAPPCT